MIILYNWLDELFNDSLITHKDSIVFIDSCF